MNLSVKEADQLGLLLILTFLSFSIGLVLLYGRKRASEKDYELWNRLKEQNRY